MVFACCPLHLRLNLEICIKWEISSKKVSHPSRFQQSKTNSVNMNKLAWALVLTISALTSGEPSPGRNAVEDDLNQLMSRFMFDDYETNIWQLA